MTTEKDETFTILVKGKVLASVKADLIHAFLSVSFFLLNIPRLYIIDQKFGVIKKFYKIQLFKKKNLKLNRIN